MAQSAIAYDSTAPGPSIAASGRELYIDGLRTVLTALVILHHTAITYGASGGWFWNELHPSSAPSSLLLTLFVATQQAYFMGFFFLLAGYFTPGSLERKGYARFISDRLLRLGLPLLAFIFLLGPTTAALVDAAQGRGFWPTFVWLWNHGRIINGPMWFVQALLIFSFAYCAWRALFGFSLSNREKSDKPVPAYGVWLLSAVTVGVGAFAIRLAVPTGVNIFGLQLGYFASYIFLFALGIAAWRHDWLRKLSWTHARPWFIASALAWISMPVVLVLATRAHNSGGASHFAGGLHWEAFFYAMWEPFLAWGLIAAWLLVFRTYRNYPSSFWSWLNRRAYAVYIIHPPILVGIALLLHGWIAPALLKFVVTGALTCCACWLLADPLVRLPGLRRIL